MAVYFGSYEVVQICLNKGADPHFKDREGRTALEHSRRMGFYHIEQLLLFNEMNASIGTKIKNTSDSINKQRGITQNIMKQLSSYDSSTSQFFKDTLVDIMINIIDKKLIFSDQLLDICWNIVAEENKGNALLSKLWNEIKNKDFT